ncbi:MAG TPA: BTAD domain-containing putative transcriptional regulator [Usitatibacter sp.]|nr:BTAD domain-containing putative transcriptional regulator [Usitatibacter sp.]
MDRLRQQTRTQMSPGDRAFLALPEALDARVAEAWRLLVADPARSGMLAADAREAVRMPLDRAWSILCSLYHAARSGRLEEADDLLRAARAAFAQIPDERGTSLTDVGEGYVLLARGRPDAAVEAIERALDRHTRAPTVAPLDHFLAYHALALARTRQGLLDDVIQHHYANLLLLEQSAQPAPLAVVLLNLSSTLTAIDDWEESLALALRAVECCGHFHNPALERRARINVALAHRFLGHMEEALALLESLREEVYHDPGSDFALYINSAEALAHHGDATAAVRWLERARACAAPGGDGHERANLAWVEGLIAARGDEVAHAIASLEAAKAEVNALRKLHVPLLPRIVEVLASCYARSGDPARAFETFRQFHESFQARLGYTIRARYRGRQSRQGVAAIETALWSGSNGDADKPAQHARLSEALRRTLAAVDEPAGALPGWSPQSIARIASEAHDLGVASQHVGGLMENLLRAPDASRLESPSQSVRVCLLGGFDIEADGRPLRFGRKRPERPLALLKYLGTHGSRAAPEVEIADALWPDLEGDAALRALAVNLHRLRHLLGGADAVSHQGRALALNTRRVWCDAATFEWLLDRAAAAPDEERRAGFTARAIALYRGDLPVDEDREPWANGARRRLRARFVGACGAQGSRHAAAARWEEACASFARGLEHDAAAEELCLGLMRGCLALARPQQGIAAYRRLEAALVEERRQRPNAAVEGLFKELLAHAR